jgi:tetratricopeptide (TPR) repeat protein
MKRIAITAVVLSVCVLAFGQDKTKQQGTTAGQTPAQPAGQAAAPPGKRPPQAKTQPEFEAYDAAMALKARPRLQELQSKASPTDPEKQEMTSLRQKIEAADNPVNAEKAANDFAAKFPDSELRVVLYKSAMQKYASTGNSDKMLEMGQKALTFDQDDPEALVTVAQVLTERTKDTALDKDERLAEAKKDAERALVTVDTDVPTAGYPAERIDMFKRFVKSEAYAILGTLATNAENYPEAETQLKKSIEVFPEQVDPVAVLRLAIALDKQNKTADALKYANQAVDLTKDQPDGPAGKAARAEQDRLKALSSGTAPGQPATPAKN